MFGLLPLVGVHALARFCSLKAVHQRASRTFILRRLKALAALLVLAGAAQGADLERIQFNHPGLVVDLGVGLWAWPLPMDYDGDGDHDLIVVCPDVPYNGTYFFENVDGNVAMPTFRPPVKVSRGMQNVQVCYVDGQPRVLSPGKEYQDFTKQQFRLPKEIAARPDFHAGRIRANQWKYADYDGDGILDLVVGVGDWADYGWDDAFDQEGSWTNGPLHGYVYWIHNRGSNQHPRYADPAQLRSNKQPIDVYGMPSPNIADFDGDGDLDLICGEFLAGFTFFENIGTRSAPIWAAGRQLIHQGKAIEMDLQMITPTAIDWDRDGDVDLVVGDEDGRVAFVENSGRLESGMPQFLPPAYFKQLADELKFGALVTPDSVDWDGDGDEDLICGNTAGYIGFIENLDGGDPPQWAAPVRLEVDSRPIRITAGKQGSIQGPCEAKWGYTTVSVADWDNDGLLDIVANSIWGKVVWFKNVGQPRAPRLSAAQPVRVALPTRISKPTWNWWDPESDEFVTQWRTTPAVFDWNRDGLLDLVMLDSEGFLTLSARRRVDNRLRLSAPQRIFHAEKQHTFNSRHGNAPDGDGLLRLNSGDAGRSGRRKFTIVDWDGDGRNDFLVNSVNVNLMRNVSDGQGVVVKLRDLGSLSSRKLAGHTTSPTTVDWDRNGIPDLLVGAEDGMFYYLRNPRGR